MVRTEATQVSASNGTVNRPGLLVAGLSVVVLTVAVLQTAVVPVLGIIAAQLHASTVAASWAVTANLLAAAAATPLIGRLADLHSKKRCCSPSSSWCWSVHCSPRRRRHWRC